MTDTDELATALQNLNDRVARIELRDAEAERVAALIALVVDVKGCEQRFSELRKLGREIARARLEFGAEERAHAEAVAKLEADRAELVKRERAVEQGEASVKARLECLSRPSSYDPRMRHFPGGMTAEPDDEPPSRAADPHFGKQSATAADDETELVPVPGYGTAHTLTSSVPVPKSRRSMRRGVDG